MHKTIQVSDIKQAAQEAYKLYRDDKSGKNANYIPFLANVDSDLFGITICLLDGREISFGDVDYSFGIESISKVFTAILAMSQHGPETLLKRIGADATGLPFNSIMAILLERDHPSTPLVNAGAIAAVSMVEPVGDADAKWSAITKTMQDLCGEDLPLLDELYRSESATNSNNHAIAWLLKNYNRIYDDPDLSLDLYTRQCSLGITTRQLALAAATIANDGVNPKTGEAVFDASFAPKIVSLIATVGLYERTGDWMYMTGVPAKSGVGGGVMGILPGLFGIAAFSPLLDYSGSSIRAQKAIHYVAETLQMSIFGSQHYTIVDE